MLEKSGGSYTLRVVHFWGSYTLGGRTLLGGGYTLCKASLTLAEIFGKSKSNFILTTFLPGGDVFLVKNPSTNPHGF